MQRENPTVISWIQEIGAFTGSFHERMGQAHNLSQKTGVTEKNWLRIINLPLHLYFLFLKSTMAEMKTTNMPVNRALNPSGVSTLSKIEMPCI